jgi:hypothetical protein
MGSAVHKQLEAWDLVLVFTLSSEEIKFFLLPKVSE